MERKDKENKFLNTIINAGNWIYSLALLQFLSLVYTLRGFVILGFFPSLAAVVKVAYRWFDKKEVDFSIWKEFQAGYKSYFKAANQIGYVLLLLGAIFYIDLRISNVFIQSILLHSGLLFLGFALICMSLYTFTTLVRYDFSVKNVLKQSFFVAYSVPIFTLSAVVSLILVTELLRNYLFLAMFFGIPFFIIPVVWFTYTGLKKAEERKDELIKEGH